MREREREREGGSFLQQWNRYSDQLFTLFGKKYYAPLREFSNVLSMASYNGNKTIADGEKRDLTDLLSRVRALLLCIRPFR